MMSKGFYAIALLYKIQISSAKISMCVFFLRIFPSNSFRIYAAIVIVVNALIGFIFFFIDAFQCSPVSAAWEGWAKEYPAKCLNFPITTFCNGFLNIGTDIAMISLPIYETSKLKLELTKKIGIATMFALGFVSV